MAARTLTDNSVAEIMQHARDVREGIQGADCAAKRRMLEALKVSVTVKEGV